MSIEPLIQSRKIDQPKVRSASCRVAPKPEETELLNQVFFDRDGTDVDHGYKARMRAQALPSNSKTSLAPTDHIIPSAALR